MKNVLRVLDSFGNPRVKFRRSYYECGDGCCDDYIEAVYVDGEELTHYIDLGVLTEMLDKLGVPYEMDDTVSEDIAFYRECWEADQLYWEEQQELQDEEVDGDDDE